MIDGSRKLASAPGPVTESIVLRDLAGFGSMGMERRAMEAGDSATGEEGLGVLGEGCGTRKAKEGTQGLPSF